MGNMKPGMDTKIWKHNIRRAVFVERKFRSDRSEVCPRRTCCPGNNPVDVSASAHSGGTKIARAPLCCPYPNHANYSPPGSCLDRLTVLTGTIPPPANRDTILQPQGCNSHNAVPLMWPRVLGVCIDR